MKIAFACNHYPPEFLGGTERVVQALARALAASGDDVVVLCSTEGEVGEESIDGVSVFRFAHAEDEHYGLRVPRQKLLDQCAKVLRDRQIDLLHVHHWSHLSDQLLQRAAELRIGRVATLHDMWTHCPRFFRLPPAGSDVQCPTGSSRSACVTCANLDYHADEQSLAALFADRDRNLRTELGAAQVLTAPSQSCADAFARHSGIAIDIRVVPHGLLQPVVAPDDRVPHAPFRIGSFGNQGWEKGSMELVEAVVDVPNVEVHFWGGFVSEGMQKEIEARAATLGVTLVCHGRYDEAGLHPAAQLDLAVFYSQCEETYGLVVDEALAHGLPAIVSNRGALPERVADGGGVVVANTAELREAVWKVAIDPAEWRRYRASIPASFLTVKDAVQAYRSLYREVVG